MTLKDCYTVMGGDYNGVMKRLRSEKLVLKFVTSFLEVSNMADLRNALVVGDQTRAFEIAHTMKGVCLNLGFSKLGESSSKLTDALRTEISDEVPALMEQVEADYAEVVRVMQLRD